MNTNRNLKPSRPDAGRRPGVLRSWVVFLSILTTTWIGACAQTGAAQGENLGPAAPESCPVTLAPAVAFIPPPPFAAAPAAGQSWYGSPSLWTVISETGVWEALPQSKAGYGQKLFFWSEDYSAEEKEPQFEVVAKKMDAPLTVNNDGASNGSHSELGAFIVTGIELPEAGCWVITGSYRGESLSYTVWVVGSDGN